jgi:hypothetical protein
LVVGIRLLHLPAAAGVGLRAAAHPLLVAGHPLRAAGHPLRAAAHLVVVAALLLPGVEAVGLLFLPAVVEVAELRLQ